MRFIRRIRMPGLFDELGLVIDSDGGRCAGIRMAAVLELPTLISTESRGMPEISRFFGIVVAI